jgi:hypothetical protein
MDATTNLSREIRGMLVATGEDVPEHTASALARSIIIEVPQRAKDLERGERCARECRHYSGVMADFVRHLIAKERIEGFQDRVAKKQQLFYQGIAGKQNDARIASNFALLAVAFEEMAAYLEDVWPEGKQEARRFVEEDLMAIRNAMLEQVRDQQPSEVFLTTLASLIETSQVKILGFQGTEESSGVIGRFTGTELELNTALSLEAVNQSLQKQCRPPLRITIKALLAQLAQEGKLMAETNPRFDVEVGPSWTHQCWLNGKNVRVFRISPQTLFNTAPAEEVKS